MEISKIIESFEKLLYEISVLIVLIPKTLFKALFHPSWCYTYTKQQFTLEVEKRFNDYVSPLILFSWIYLIPFYLILTSLGDIGDSPELLKKIIGENIESTDQLLLLSIYVNLQPIFLSTGLLMMKKIPIDKTSFKEPFYYFTYLFAIYSVVFVISTVALMCSYVFFVFDEIAFYGFLCLLFGLIALWSQIALIIGFTKIFITELRVQWWNALSRVILIFTIGFTIFFSVVYMFEGSDDSEETEEIELVEPE